MPLRAYLHSHSQYSTLRNQNLFQTHPTYISYQTFSYSFQPQGGYGSVQGITFSNIQVYEVEIPIMIDQFYCASDKSECRNDTSAVAVSGINYVKIWGTYTVKPLHFACSNSLPCTGLSLANIELTPLPSYNLELCGSFCWKAYGTLRTRTVPPIDCLMPSKLSSTRVQSHGNSCWYQPQGQMQCMDAVVSHVQLS